MPLFAVLFEDDPPRADEIRRRHLPAHLDFLARHADRIRAAGPLRDGGGAAGGLWLVEAADAASVDALVRDDPFWPTGLRRSVRITEWVQVFADGARRI
jgi:uncharacterized protein YciI